MPLEDRQARLPGEERANIRLLAKFSNFGAVSNAFLRAFKAALFDLCQPVCKVDLLSSILGGASFGANR